MSTFSILKLHLDIIKERHWELRGRLARWSYLGGAWYGYLDFPILGLNGLKIWSRFFLAWIPNTPPLLPPRYDGETDKIRNLENRVFYSASHDA